MRIISNQLLSLLNSTLLTVVHIAVLAFVGIVLIRFVFEGDYDQLTVASIGLIFAIVRYFDLRNQVQTQQEFQNYHQLIKELTGTCEGENLKLDHQIAVVYELRHFPKYYEVSQRILKGLKDHWSELDLAMVNTCQSNNDHPIKLKNDRLIQEIDITLALIVQLSQKEK